MFSPKIKKIDLGSEARQGQSYYEYFYLSEQEIDKHVRFFVKIDDGEDDDSDEDSDNEDYDHGDYDSDSDTDTDSVATDIACKKITLTVYMLGYRSETKKYIPVTEKWLTEITQTITNLVLIETSVKHKFKIGFVMSMIDFPLEEFVLDSEYLFALGVRSILRLDVKISDEGLTIFPHSAATATTFFFNVVVDGLYKDIASSINMKKHAAEDLLFEYDGKVRFSAYHGGYLMQKCEWLLHADHQLTRKLLRRFPDDMMILGSAGNQYNDSEEYEKPCTVAQHKTRLAMIEAEYYCDIDAPLKEFNNVATRQISEMLSAFALASFAHDYVLPFVAVAHRPIALIIE